MPRKRIQKIVGLSMCCGTIVVTMFLFINGSGYLHEQWYLFLLSSNDYHKRNQAADSLAAMKSMRSVPRIVELIAKDKRERVVFVGADKIAKKYTPLVYSLYKVGPGASNILRRLVAAEYKSGVNLNLCIIVDEILKDWERPQHSMENVDRIDS